MNKHPIISTLGDSAVLIEIDSKLSDEANDRVHIFANYLIEHPIIGMLEVVPTFFSLTLFYDPFVVHLHDPTRSPNKVIKEKLLQAYQFVSQLPSNSFEAKEIEIPVCYGGDFGPDLMNVAEQHGLTAKEAIQLHSKTLYRVYMLGFSPGFAYLGGLHEQLHTPRRSSPREKISAGSVGIGGSQTAIYPLATPGGWNIIGRTPFDLFTPENEIPTLLKPGYKLRFIPIEEEEFEVIRKGVK